MPELAGASINRSDDCDDTIRPTCAAWTQAFLSSLAKLHQSAVGGAPDGIQSSLAGSGAVEDRHSDVDAHLGLNERNAKAGLVEDRSHQRDELWIKLHSQLRNRVYVVPPQTGHGFVAGRAFDHAQRISCQNSLTAPADDQFSIDLLVQPALFQLVRR